MNQSEIINIISQLKTIKITTNDFNYCYEGILRCMEQTFQFEESYGCLLLAEGGLGKTTICKAIMNKFPPSTKIEKDYIKQVIPVFYIAVPSPVTVKSIAGIMLAALNDPNPFSGTTAQMTIRLCQHLKTSETKLIFLDECHHLFDMLKTSKKINTTVCNWIKTLVDQTGICFCLVGLPDFLSLLQIDTQLARRFPVIYKISPLWMGKINQNDNLGSFLKTLDEQINQKTGVSFQLKLNDPLLKLQIYVATQGNHSYVMKLVKESIRFALENDQFIVNSQHFEEAWNTGITSFTTLSNRNPFNLSLAELASKIRREN